MLRTEIYHWSSGCRYAMMRDLNPHYIPILTWLEMEASYATGSESQHSQAHPLELSIRAS